MIMFLTMTINDYLFFKQSEGMLFFRSVNKLRPYIRRTIYGML